MSALNEESPNPMDGDQSVPPGWKQITLEDVLTPEQQKHVAGLLRTHKDPEKLLAALKSYFATIASDLAGFGVVPDFLAYIIYGKAIGII